MCTYTTDEKLSNKPATLKKGKHIQRRCSVLVLDTLAHLFFCVYKKTESACMVLNILAYRCVRSIFVTVFLNRSDQWNFLIRTNMTWREYENDQSIRM
jgi:hypothetical protein